VVHCARIHNVYVHSYQIVHGTFYLLALNPKWSQNRASRMWYKLYGLGPNRPE